MKSIVTTKHGRVQFTIGHQTFILSMSKPTVARVKWYARQLRAAFRALNVAPLTKAERSVVRSAERFQLDWDGKTLEDTYDTALPVAHAVCRLNTERAKTKGKKR